MVAVARTICKQSPSADTFEEGAVKPKFLSSPALSVISTVALSETEVLEFSEDEDAGAEEPSEAFQWCLVGSRIAPVFASLLDANELEDLPIHTPQSEKARPSSVTDAQADEQWRHVGLRLAAVMKEALNDVDDEEVPFSAHVHRSEPLHVGAEADEHSWQLVGLRLASLFSSFDCDGEIIRPTTCADKAATTTVESSRIREYCSLDDHRRWHTVGSRLAAALREAEQ